MQSKHLFLPTIPIILLNHAKMLIENKDCVLVGIRFCDSQGGIALKPHFDFDWNVAT